MENFLISWREAVTNAINKFINDFLTNVPNIIGALLIAIIGIFLSYFFARVTRKLIDYTGIDTLLSNTEMFDTLKKRGIEFNTAEMAAFGVRWFIIVITLFTAADVLHWNQLTIFLKSVALYLPNVIIAIFIIAIGLVLGNQYHKTIRKTIKILHLPAGSARILGELARWSILIFTAMAAMNQLGVATELIKILFTGFVLMVSLAGGLAFGLGGKNFVEKWLASLNSNKEPPKGDD